MDSQPWGWPLNNMGLNFTGQLENNPHINRSAQIKPTLFTRPLLQFQADSENHLLVLGLISTENLYTKDHIYFIYTKDSLSFSAHGNRMLRLFFLNRSQYENKHFKIILYLSVSNEQMSWAPKLYYLWPLRGKASFPLRYPHISSHERIIQKYLVKGQINHWKLRRKIVHIWVYIFENNLLFWQKWNDATMFLRLLFLIRYFSSFYTFKINNLIKPCSKYNLWRYQLIQLNLSRVHVSAHIQHNRRSHAVQD